MKKKGKWETSQKNSIIIALLGHHTSMCLENYVIYYIFLDFSIAVLLVNTIETIVQGGVVINVFNLPGSSQTTQAAGTFEGTSIVPIALEQEQVAGVEGSLPQQIQENQQDHTTESDYWNLILSLRRPLESFCQYLKNMLNVVVRHHPLTK